MRRSVKGPRQVCKKDGGANPQPGPTHHSWKDGSRSKAMPKSLVATFQEAMDNKELLDLAADIATQEARIVELIGGLGDQSPGQLWKDALAEYNQFIEAVEAEDKPAVGQHRRRLLEILTQGQDEVGTWQLIQRHTEDKRRLIDTETRRREKMQNYIRFEDAAFSYRALALAVKANVKDPAILAAIAEDWARTAGLPDLSGTATGDL